MGDSWLDIQGNAPTGSRSLAQAYTGIHKSMRCTVTHTHVHTRTLKTRYDETEATLVDI